MRVQFHWATLKVQTQVMSTFAIFQGVHASEMKSGEMNFFEMREFCREFWSFDWCQGILS